MAEGVSVVSNTTPLINLAGVGLLELLPNLYGSVTAAEIVIAEYEAKARTDDLGLRSAAWLTIVAISVPDDLAAILDAGEAATIALAQQLKPRLVLLDERRGRRIARERGLPIIGTGPSSWKRSARGFFRRSRLCSTRWWHRDATSLSSFGSRCLRQPVSKGEESFTQNEGEPGCTLTEI